MRIRRAVCVVVDAYSTANTLPRVFAGYGFDSVHVQSDTYMPEVLTRSFRREDFVDHAVYRGDLEALCHALNLESFDVKCVIAGAESGVRLADRLSERLGVPTNGTEYSEARRNKFLMGETVRKAGLAAIPQCKTSKIEEAVQWVEDNGFPTVVLKPMASSGTYGFHRCTGINEVRTAFGRLRGSQDIFGTTVDEVLVQPYIEGEEYCVNTVSYNGHHYVSDVWHTKKRVNVHSKVYDLETMVLPGTDLHDTLTRYTEQVLAALRIRFGPSHTEIFVDKSGRPILIESGARFMGSVALSLITEAMGTNPVLLTAEAFLTPHAFAARMKAPRLPAGKLPAMVQMVSCSEGVLGRYAIEKLGALETFHGVDLYLKPGDAVRRTVDSYSSPGLIFLNGSSQDSLLKDYEAIRRMEERGELYELAARHELQAHIASK